MIASQCPTFQIAYTTVGGRWIYLKCAWSLASFFYSSFFESAVPIFRVLRVVQSVPAAAHPPGVTDPAIEGSTGRGGPGYGGDGGPRALQRVKRVAWIASSVTNSPA